MAYGLGDLLYVSRAAFAGFIPQDFSIGPGRLPYALVEAES